MKIVACKDYDEMSEKAGDAVFAYLRAHPSQLLCAATGNSPLGLYRHLAHKFSDDAGIFGKLGILKLDEWEGLSADDPASCEAYLLKNLLLPLHIPVERYLGFRNRAEDPEKDCNRVEQEIGRWGGIGCTILGMGANGHIGFNEPGDRLNPYSHVARLEAVTSMHAMLDGKTSKPEFGQTLGMKTILESRKIVLLLTGKEKRGIIQKLLKGKITTRLPASFLWLHPNVTCFRDMRTTAHD